MYFNQQVKELSTSPDNRICIDCKANNTHWASTSYGIFFCLECAAKHRSYGVSISRVKSINMDNWSENELNIMEKGGNKKFREYIEYNGLGSLDKDNLYKHDLVKQYKENVYGKEEEKISKEYCPKPKKYDYEDRHSYSVQNSNMKEYIGIKAGQLKTKGFEIGSSINKKWLSPTAVFMKDTFVKMKNKLSRTEVKKETEGGVYQSVKPVENKKDDLSKWD